MASKEVKALLKAAKSYVGKKDFQEVARHCEAVFAIDPAHYHAHVFAGIAAVGLGQRAAALDHYRTAISTNPEDLLGWKGLADFYDKQDTCGTEEKNEAIKALNKVLQLTDKSDHVKHCQLLGRLAKLYSETRNRDQAVDCYQQLLSLSDPPPTITQLEGVTYLLQLHDLPEGVWSLVEKTYERVIVSMDVPRVQRRKTRANYVQRIMEKLETQPALNSVFEQQVRAECVAGIKEEEVEEQKDKELGNTYLVEVLVKLELWKMLQGLVCTGVVPVLDTEHQEYLRCLCSQCDTNYSSALQALVKKKEKFQLPSGAVSSCTCDCLAVFAYAHLHCHDYQAAEQLTSQGTRVVSSAPQFLSQKLEQFLKLCQCEALVLHGGQVYIQQALAVMKEVWSELGTDVSDCVVRAMVMVKLADDDVEGAMQALDCYHNKDNSEFLCLEGQVLMAKGEFSTAQERLRMAVTQCPDNNWYQMYLGKSLWLGTTTKKQAYPVLVKAAQLDPLNAQTFLLLGHYQSLFSKDSTRAIKCYRKAVALQPSLVEAGMALGNALRMAGDEVGAYEAYQLVTKSSLSSEAKEAWLRVGLYQHKEGDHDTAIKCYLKVLSFDDSNHHVWECLGDAYLSRGSYSPALNSFSRAVQLHPGSLYSLYQMAAIKHHVGLLEEAVHEYTAVLATDGGYVPALKGRAESLLSLAHLALSDNFDQKAADLISVALKDLTKAVILRPSFVCLWQLIGNCCMALHEVPAHLRVEVPVQLVSSSEDVDLSSTATQSLGKVDLLQTAIRMYGHALNMCGGVSHNLWHNLGIAYYYLGQHFELESDSRADEMLQLSLKVLKKAVSMAAKVPSHWNALGIVSACKRVGHCALAQHAFISSLTNNPNDAIVWSNLGCLYLINHYIELAHKSFQNAQSSDPHCVRGWIGQALVAEEAQPLEAMDLFRHASEIQYHSEAAAGHAHWVCHTLTTVDPAIILSSSGALNATAHQSMLQARDNALKYVSRHPKDPHLLNLLGLLYEQEGTDRLAQEIFTRAAGALSSTETTESAMVSANTARVLSKLGRHSEALQCYEMLGDVLDISTALYRALTLYRAGMVGEALIAYQSLYDSVQSEDQAGVLLVQAMINCAVENWEEAKTLLFKVFQTPPLSLQGLILSSAYACYIDDTTLLQATLSEMLTMTVAGQFLHPSCCTVLEAIGVILSNNEETISMYECVHGLVGALSDFREFPSMPLPCQTHTLSLVELQKVVHSCPADIWSLAMLTSKLMANEATIARSFLELVALMAREKMAASSENIQQQIAAGIKHDISLLLNWCKAQSVN